MNKAQQTAWEWLSETEQRSLFLTLSTGKSSWEAGEMLKISHYKYLEIKERSEVFFKLFTSFLEKHEALFRPDGPCQEDFKDYMEAVICKRKTRKEAALFSGYSANLLSEVSNRKIEVNMNRLKESDNQWDQETRAIILEFDRWNNFRILPKMLQQPSAYKRRLNKKDKIYIKYLLNSSKMPEWLLERIKERFYFKTKRDDRRYWVALISKSLSKDGYFLLPIRRSEEVVNEMSKFYIYVFENKDDADSFGFKVANYRTQTARVRLGLKFWPEYREVVKQAINYGSINNLDFNVKTLDMAYSNIQPRKKKKLKEDSGKPGMSRAKSSAFYNKSTK